MRSKRVGERSIAIRTVGRGFSRNWRAITFAHEKKFDAAANWRVAIIIAAGRKKREEKNRQLRRNLEKL